ncbi:MAG TPA: hypothetical protein VM734_34720 [Kofleriaceae bacterium]|nr:hypothetical protein [Kofleriaceae bacterium]
MSRSVALIASVLFACSSRVTPIAPPVSSTAPARAPSLLAYVPADTPYVFHVGADMFSLPSISFDYRTARSKIVTGLSAAVLPADELAEAAPRERLGSELARELLPLDEQARARVGWIAGKSGFVLYGLGLVPVLRVRLDGTQARAALGRVLARAKIEVAEARWHDVPYVLLPPLAASAPPLVVVFHPDQVVAAFAREPHEILPHLADRNPLPASLASWNPRRADPDVPADANLMFLFEPARAAARLRTADDLAQLTARSVDRACLGAIAGLLDGLPALTNSHWVDGPRVGSAYTIELAPATAKALRAGAGIPHWLTDDARPRIQFAFAIPLAALEAAARRFYAALAATDRACDPDEPMPAFPDALRELGPLAHATGGSYVLEIEPGRGDRPDQIGMAGLIAVPDVAGVWAWLSRMVPLGPLPPVGEVLPFPLGTDQVRIMVGPRAVGGSAGAFDASRLRRLMTSDGLGGVVAALEVDAAAVESVRGGAQIFGEPMDDEEDEDDDEPVHDTLIFARIAGNHLVMRSEVEMDGT